jgi:hypothetical protein
MGAKPFTITLPGSLLAEEFGPLSHELAVELFERGAREWRIDRALALYAQGRLSFGAAAERARISQTVSRSAYARGLEPPFSAKTLAEELG